MIYFGIDNATSWQQLVPPFKAELRWQVIEALACYFTFHFSRLTYLHPFLLLPTFTHAFFI